MKIESFTKKIYKSTLISSLLTNILTVAVVFFISNNLVFRVYNNQYHKSNDYISNYINRIIINDDFYRDITLFEDNKSNKDFNELQDFVTQRTSRFRGISIYFEDKNRDPREYLPPNLYDIYNRLNNKDLQQHVIEHKSKIYIINIKSFKKYIHIQFFNLTDSKIIKTVLLNEGFLGYSIKDKYYKLNDISEIDINNSLFQIFDIEPKEIIIDTMIIVPGIKLHTSSINQFSDSLTLFFTIFILSMIRLLVSLLNAKRTVKQITKPLMDLVKNTEKLASHEVCEKLNRFDYPYLEFKQLAEAFNKVLLSRELSEIKLFRSFEQMESVVHKRTQELITANEQLTNAITKAEEANASKSQFLANISHEIRTPLNCIMGFCDIILTENHNDSVTVQVKQILHESETLLHLINDFLDYSKIDAGKMSLLDTELDIRSLIGSLMKSGQVQVGDKNIELLKDISDSIPQIIIADELRLYQVISNIFYNAIKFTPTGSVKIKIDNATAGKSDNFYIEISIIDTGIGIPEDRLDTIFDKFEQVDGSLTRKYRGSGLGLTICKKIVELMKGSIVVKSEVNKGSIFTITLPVKIQQNEVIESKIIPKSRETEVHLEGSRILLVEDYPVNQIVAKKHLEMDRHYVTVAENGQEAVELSKENQFDLILMDLQMPIMDGFKATKIIRGTAGYNRTTPILAMTANAMDTAKQTCLDTGMNGIITKPIRKKMFLKEVDKWLKINKKEGVTPL